MAEKLKRSPAVQSSLQNYIFYMYSFIKNDPREKSIFDTGSETEVLVRIAQLLGVFLCINYDFMLTLGFNIVQKIVKRGKGGEKFVTPAKKRKRGYPVMGIDNFSQEAITCYIYDNLHKGYPLTAKEVWQLVRENPEVFLFKGSLSSMRKVIRSLGFRWKKGDKYCHLKESSDITFRRSCFLTEYGKNMRSEWPLPVVFLDETWIYMNGKPPSKSWCKPGETKAVLKRPPESRRLVVVHAGSKEGFVPNADLLFVTNLKTGDDYHGAMDSTNFEKWTREKLIAGLKNMGRCMVVLDNASYHSRLLEKQPTTKWRKDQLMMWLNQHGVCPPANAKKDYLQGMCKVFKTNLKSLHVA